jgi:hypothetical protein
MAATPSGFIGNNALMIAEGRRPGQGSGWRGGKKKNGEGGSPCGSKPPSFAAINASPQGVNSEL